MPCYSHRRSTIVSLGTFTFNCEDSFTTRHERKKFVCNAHLGDFDMQMSLTHSLTHTDFPINQNICIVNKNRMKHWLLSKVKGHDILDKGLLRAERRSCNSNFSTECQSLDTEFRLKSSMKRMTSIWCFFRNVKRS